MEKAVVGSSPEEPDNETPCSPPHSFSENGNTETVKHPAEAILSVKKKGGKIITELINKLTLQILRLLLVAAVDQCNQLKHGDTFEPSQRGIKFYFFQFGFP